ncbi:MAG TPA: histidine phosphatase family protein [bacterium]|jgi:probable phosphoglycerate mutase
MSDTQATNKLNGPAVLLARHGETDFNLNKIFQGRTDNPLNDNGLSQAVLIKARIEPFEISAAYASPLIRAQETADIALGDKNIPIGTDPRLIEIDFGKWEGTPEAIVKTKYPDEYVAYRSDMSKFHPSDGESAVEAMARAGGWWEDARSNHSSSETIIVFAHQSINACLACYITETSLSDAWTNFKCAPGDVIRIVPTTIPLISKLTLP